MQYSIFRIMINCNFLIITLLLLQGCATREEIARRNLLAKLDTEMNSSQSTSSGLIGRVMELEDRLGIIHGKMEENQHKTVEDQTLRAQGLSDEIAILKEEVTNLKNENLNIQKQLKENENYLKRVLSKLNSISGGGSKKGQNGNEYDQAMNSYKKGQYKTASKQLEKLLTSNKYKGNKQARILHNLGLIDFMAGKYKTSLVYLSKLFTNHPTSKYNSRGLLFLGKSFQKLGQKEEAKQAFQELMKNFPKSKQATEAKKILKVM